METNAPRRSERPKCAVHGLAYDPAIQSGCVICRRELGENATSADASARGSTRSRYLWIGLVAANLVVFWIAWRENDRPAGNTAAAVAEAPVAAHGSASATAHQPSPGAADPAAANEPDPKGNPMHYRALKFDTGTANILEAAGVGNGAAMRRLIRHGGVSI